MTPEATFQSDTVRAVSEYSSLSIRSTRPSPVTANKRLACWLGSAYGSGQRAYPKGEGSSGSRNRAPLSPQKETRLSLPVDTTCTTPLLQCGQVRGPPSNQHSCTTNTHTQKNTTTWRLHCSMHEERTLLLKNSTSLAKLLVGRTDVLAQARISQSVRKGASPPTACEE